MTGLRLTAAAGAFTLLVAGLSPLPAAAKEKSSKARNTQYISPSQEGRAQYKFDQSGRPIKPEDQKKQEKAKKEKKQAKKGKKWASQPGKRRPNSARSAPVEQDPADVVEEDGEAEPEPQAGGASEPEPQAGGAGDPDSQAGGAPPDSEPPAEDGGQVTFGGIPPQGQ
ncbi:MAG: hypothetical protein ABIJ96_15955 [Elusimicrobiota bacterium]